MKPEMQARKGNAVVHVGLWNNTFSGPGQHEMCDVLVWETQEITLLGLNHFSIPILVVLVLFYTLSYPSTLESKHMQNMEVKWNKSNVR